MLPLVLVLTSTLALAAAPPISSGATLLTGIGATFDGDPATVRLEVQGEVPLYPSETIGVGLVLPLEMTLSGQNAFGVTLANSMFTFLPSARLRAANGAPVRVYADAGVGVAVITAKTDFWMFERSTNRIGWATRLVLGFEVGSPEGGIAFVFEPLGIDTLHFEEEHSVGYVGRIGVGVRY